VWRSGSFFKTVSMQVPVESSCRESAKKMSDRSLTVLRSERKTLRKSSCAQVLECSWTWSSFACVSTFRTTPDTRVDTPAVLIWRNTNEP